MIWWNAEVHYRDHEGPDQMNQAHTLPSSRLSTDLAPSRFTFSAYRLLNPDLHRDTCNMYNINGKQMNAHEKEAFAAHYESQAV
jgi:hypothetical protein